MTDQQTLDSGGLDDSQEEYGKSYIICYLPYIRIDIENLDNQAELFKIAYLLLPCADVHIYQTNITPFVTCVNVELTEVLINLLV